MYYRNIINDPDFKIKHAQRNVHNEQHRPKLKSHYPLFGSIIEAGANRQPSFRRKTRIAEGARPDDYQR